MKGAPSLFKFGFKVVPREEAAANQCWRGHASECALRRVGGFLSSDWRSATPTNVGGGMSGRALRGVVGCLSWRPATPTKNCVHQGVALLGPVQEGRRLVAMRVHCVANGDRRCFEALMLPQPVHSTSILAPNPLRCHVERPPFQV
jgi:hypothetical protein